MWKLVDRTKIEARGKHILPSTWVVFKKKRFPDGMVKKLKARWCVRGDRQIHGVDYFETFAPVVAWSTIRLLLILTVSMGLSTAQVDYTNAFIQAGLDEEVYVECPRMFETTKKVMRLTRNVYGLRQAPLNWFKQLKMSLEQRGSKQSSMETTEDVTVP